MTATSLTAADKNISQSAGALCRAVEKHLTTGIFGSGEAISATADAYYRGVAGLCADVCGVERSQLLSASSPQLEAMRRSALDIALREALAGRVTTARQALDGYLPLWATYESDQNLVRDGVAAASAGVPIFLGAWAGHPLAEKLVTRFGESMAGASDGSNVVIEPISTAHEAGRVRSLAVLQQALPALSADVLSTVPAIGIFRGDLISGYSTIAPLHIFVNASFFDDTVAAAELVLHECLHQKLNDLSLARAMFGPAYIDAESPTLKVPWSVDGNEPRFFSADRCFAAFHVYTHQALFYLGMLATQVGGDTDTTVERLVISWARANHFASGLANSPVRDEFGPDGLQFTTWLNTAVDNLGEFVLPTGDPLHSGAENYSATEAMQSPE